MERILKMKSIIMITAFALIVVMALSIGLFIFRSQIKYFDIVITVFYIGIYIFAISFQKIIEKIGIRKLKTKDWKLDTVYSKTELVGYRSLAILLIVIFIGLSMTLTHMPYFLLLIAIIILMEIEYTKIIISKDLMIVSNKVITFDEVERCEKAEGFLSYEVRISANGLSHSIRCRNKKQCRRIDEIISDKMK